MVALAIAGAGLALSAAGTHMSYRGQKKAAEAQAQQQALSVRRSRRQAIREAQIRRAQTTAVTGAAGGLTGSGYAGGIGSLGSQLATNFGFGTQMSWLSSLVNQGMQQAGLGSAISSIGSLATQTGLAFYKPTPTETRSGGYTQGGMTAFRSDMGGLLGPI